MALSIPVQCIHGNGESNILAVNRGELLDRVPERLHDAMHWVERRLPPEYLAEFAAWPLTLRLAHPEIGDILFCHATPRDDTEIFTRITPEGRLRALFDAANADLVVCGHTHMQFDRFVGSTRVINSGSVGMPYGERGAHWLLIDSDVRFRRTEYDYDGAAARIHETEFPGAHEFARLIVFSPPAELEMTERLESAAIGR